MANTLTNIIDKIKRMTDELSGRRFFIGSEWNE